MKNLFILSALFLQVLLSCSQNIYYGYPSLCVNLNKGDVIVTNIPGNRDGRFVPSDNLDSLISLIKRHNNFIFRIEISFALGSTELNEDYSEHLRKNMEAILKKECSDSNFIVVSFGDKKPFCVDYSRKNYRMYNTRIEIIIE